MDLIPSHLKNTGEVLTKLHHLTQQELCNLSFFTADVESLYTNINVHTAVQDVIDFAIENKASLNLYGLKIVDIHELLEIILTNSYFVYDSEVYLQLQGLFMGSRPAPVTATIRMWKLERESIYRDLRITLVFYARFYDDIISTTSNTRRAQLML